MSTAEAAHTDDDATTGGASIADRLGSLVGRRAAHLQAAYRKNESAAVATLAHLRRAVSQPPGHDIRVIGVTVADIYPRTATLPDEPQKAELAAHAAMTLFAVHQQSHRAASMHQIGYSFGRSARLLRKRSGGDDSVRDRFTAVATASSWAETLHHARGLIQRFRGAGVPLDYDRFARDLLALQYPGSADCVRLAWGRDFYRERHPEDDATTDNANDDTDTTDDTDSTDAAAAASDLY